MINNAAGSYFSESDNYFSQGIQMERLISNFLSNNTVTSPYLFRSDIGGNAPHSRKDIYKECDYPYTSSITLQDYQDMYERNPIAKRVVGVYPAEMWKIPPDVYEDEDPHVSTEFEQAFRDVGKHLVDEGGESYYKTEDEKGNPIWSYLHRADRLSGIGHFGIIVLGLSDGKPLDQPVAGFESEPKYQGGRLTYINNAKRKKLELLYLSVFPEISVTNIEFDTNEYSPRYRKPVMYHIDLGEDDSADYNLVGRASRTVQVHWSRVIHITDNADSSDVFGVPRQRPVWNPLLDLMKVYGGDAEGFWKNCITMLFFETHPQLGGNVSMNESQLKERVWDMTNGLQRHMALKGMSAKTIAPQVVDPKNHIDIQIDAICIQLEIAKRIFVGSERGELASSQDIIQFRDKIRSRRSDYGRSGIIVPFVNRLIHVGVLPIPKQKFSVGWEDPDQQSPKDKADNLNKRVQALAAYIRGNVGSIYPPKEFMMRELGFSEKIADDIIERAKEYQDEQDELRLQKEQMRMEAQEEFFKRYPNSTQGGVRGSTNPASSRLPNSDTKNNPNIPTGKSEIFKQTYNFDKNSEIVELESQDHLNNHLIKELKELKNTTLTPKQQEVVIRNQIEPIPINVEVKVEQEKPNIEVINNFTADVETPEVNIAPPDISLSSPEVVFSPQIHVEPTPVSFDPQINVEAPNVNVDVEPQIHVQPTPIHVEAPNVTVEAPAVTVNPPNIKVEAPHVTVEAPKSETPILQETKDQPKQPTKAKIKHSDGSTSEITLE